MLFLTLKLTFLICFYCLSSGGGGGGGGGGGNGDGGTHASQWLSFMVYFVAKFCLCSS
jgi:hypothetical protein